MVRRIGVNVNQITHNVNREMHASERDEATAAHTVRQRRKLIAGSKSSSRKPTVNNPMEFGSTPGRHDRHLSKPEPPSRPSRGTPGTMPIPFAASFVFSAAPDDWAKVSPPGTWPTAFCESQSESRE